MNTKTTCNKCSFDYLHWLLNYGKLYRKDGVVLRFGDVPWPPRSPDLSACDFFLWGYLKSKVYVRKPHIVDDLKVSIREEIATVPKEMLVNVMQNFEERLRTCVRQEGRHLSDIIFRNWVTNVSNQNCIYYRLFWCWHNFFFILKINKVTIIWKTCVLSAPLCITSPTLQYFPHYITNGTIFFCGGGELFYIKCVFWFSLLICLEHFPF